MDKEILDRIRERLEELRKEHAARELQLHKLDQQRTDLQYTLQRIAGAIQALEEMIAESKASSAEA